MAWRNIVRQKDYSFINILGLAVGMGCFLLILTYIQFELSFDRFHKKSDRLFRVAIRENNQRGGEYSVTTPAIMAKVLKGNIPEIQRAGILQISTNDVVQTDTQSFLCDGIFVDENFLFMFTFPMILGNRSTALATSNSVVLSDVMAKKAFGYVDPIGKIIHYKGRFISCDLTVTGVVKQPPKNSHLQFEYLISVATMASDKDLREWFDNWDIYGFFTYLELNKNQPIKLIEQKIRTLIQKVSPHSSSREDSVFIQPITDIHLKSQVEGETGKNNQIQTIYLFGSIALIILLIASINSMNLSTARATTRGKEIGVRKVIGANRVDLIKQFIGESFIFATLAMLFALVFFFVFFPLFTHFLGNDLTMNEVKKVPLILSILGTILFVGTFSGVYPAFVLSTFQPHSVLNEFSSSWLKGARVRNLLVIFQFSAVAVFMIGSLVVSRQLNFIKNKKLGYDRKNIVALTLLEGESIKKAKVIKSRLHEYSKILNVTISDSTPLNLGIPISGVPIKKENGERVQIDFKSAFIDYDFLNVYGIEIAQGRNFSEKFPGDAKGVLVNEALIKKVGWMYPLNNMINGFPVIGVVKDFHFDTLHKAIEPAVFYLGEGFLGKLTVGIRIRPEDLESTLAQIRKIFTETTNSQPFDFYFLDDAFNGLYRNEQKLAAIFGYFEIVSIILGCMGLFGLATCTAQRRFKEIGIRKVLGASVFDINQLISKEFLSLVILANIAAWPLGYYFMKKWLQSFAYRVTLGFDIFFLSGLAALLIALIGISFQTVKASLVNPLESIRHE